VKMKRVILLIILVFLLLFSLAGCQSSDYSNIEKISGVADQLTQKEKLEDFEYIYKILRENYPFFEVNKRVSGVDWLSKKVEYISMVKASKDDHEFNMALKKILSDLHNGHTNILSEKDYLLMKAIYERNSTINTAWLEQLNNKKAVQRYVGSQGIEQQGDENKALSDNVSTEILIDQKVAYLRIKSMNPFNIEGDIEIIKPFFYDIQDYNALIIDIRGNGGGSTDYWAQNVVPMLVSKTLISNWLFVYKGGYYTENFLKKYNKSGYKELKKISEIDTEKYNKAPTELKKNFNYYKTDYRIVEPKKSVKFNGNIYLLVDKGVYSAAESFAVFAKSTGFATLVGEKTGGDGIGSDPAMCVLPNSGFILRFPYVMGLTEDGSCNEEYKTEPDVKISESRDSKLTNDKCIQYVLEKYK